MKAISVFQETGQRSLGRAKEAIARGSSQRPRRPGEGSARGVDGTDKEINAAEYGAAPSGYDFLVIDMRVRSR